LQEPSHLEQALEFASRLYARVALREMRSHTAIRMFVGGLGVAVREARRDPETANAICRKAGVKARRLEVRVTRLIAGRRNPRKQDQIPRWANCAAYVAHPPNGDLPPADWRQAARYICRRGGLRRLSDLYACRRPEADDGHGIYYRSDAEDPTSEWFTPRYIFTALGCRFDLDPASPGHNVAPWIPADHHYTYNGLDREWFGFVWLNAPYGRDVLPLWLEKFARHANGIALVPERTSTAWWQDLVSRADMILCVNRKIPFTDATGEQTSAFPIGSTLVAIGDRGVQALVQAHRNGLGILLAPVRFE
jgi:DNA N-6-adenine-methyltransferase (Dam)